MKHARVVFPAVTACLLMAAVSAQAQSWKFDIGLNGGGSFYTNSLTEDHTGSDDARFKPGWLLGGQATLFLTPGIGLRANGTWAERPFEIQGGNNLIEDINLWAWSGDLMFRLGQPNETFEGMEFLPYLALGIGVKTVHPATEGQTVTAGDQTLNGPTFTIGSRRFLMDHKRTLKGLAGIGADLRVARGFALRLEAGDRLWDSPIYALNADGTLAENDDVGKTVNELYGQVGLHFLMGIRAPEAVAVAPAPPPPAPAPPPAPREEAVTVCVIDATAPGGIKMVTAAYMVDTRDTLVMVDGTRRPLRETTGTITTASGADWFVRGQPLMLTVGTDRTEFVTYGSSRLIDSHELAFVGTINGMPVYAEAGKVGTTRTQFEEHVRMGHDLSVALAEDRALRTNFETVDVVYVPLHPTGCVFQGLQRVEQVKKMRR